MRGLLARLRCLLGLHVWRSTFMYRIHGTVGVDYILHGRDIWENRCERCGTVSPWGVRLDSPPPKWDHTVTHGATTDMNKRTDQHFRQPEDK